MVEEGVIGFKCFMGPSGVNEFPHVTYDDIEKALTVLDGSDAVLAVKLTTYNSVNYYYINYL